MLTLNIPETKFLDDDGNFITIKATKLQLEHSLLSVKKWESTWHKAFLKKDEKTDEELLDYIRCMTITTNVDPIIFSTMSDKNVRKVIEYIEDPMTATVIPRNSNAPIKQDDVLTAELLYYYMIALNIPIEFQKWHLNQLITLINVVAIKTTKPKKLTRAERMAESARRDAINEQRRAKYKTKG